jgi:AraC-like DNA-binding protein
MSSVPEASSAPRPTVSVRFVWPFRTVSREFGLDSKEAWAAFGFTQADLSNPDTRIPADVAQQMIQWVVAITKMEDYGLRAAEAAEPGMFDLPEYAARYQPTLGGALKRIVSLVPLVSDAATLSLEHSSEKATLVLEPRSVPLDPASVEFQLAYFVLAGRRFTGVLDLCPIETRFRHPAPKDTSHHERLFGSRPLFGAADDALVLSSTSLQYPLKLADTHLARLLDQAAEHLLAQIGRRGTFADEVRRLITRHLPNDGAPVTAIAEALGITPRTLHRRLADEQTTFRDLADDVRKGLALAYLENRELSVSEVTYLLGFSGVQAFHRAFKRWMQMTPGEYRRSL